MPKTTINKSDEISWYHNIIKNIMNNNLGRIGRRIGLTALNILGHMALIPFVSPFIFYACITRNMRISGHHYPYDDEDEENQGIRDKKAFILTALLSPLLFVGGIFFGAYIGLKNGI